MLTHTPRHVELFVAIRYPKRPRGCGTIRHLCSDSVSNCVHGRHFARQRNINEVRQHGEWWILAQKTTSTKIDSKLRVVAGAPCCLLNTAPSNPQEHSGTRGKGKSQKWRRSSISTSTNVNLGQIPFPNARWNACVGYTATSLNPHTVRQVRNGNHSAYGVA